MVRFLKRAYLALVLFFLYLPIATLIIFSFNATKSRSQWGGFSLTWYISLFQDANIMRSLYVSLIVAVTATALSVLLGTLAAIGIHAMKPLTKRVTSNLSYLPMLTPDIVMGVSFMLLFKFSRLSGDWVRLILSHTAFCVPYVIFAVLPKLRQMNAHAYEAALDLGATPTVALWRVIVPEIWPGVITGALLSFTLSLDDFVVSYFVSSRTQNLSTMIYSLAKRGINPTINALSTLLFVAILVLLILVNRRSALGGDGVSEGRKRRR